MMLKTILKLVAVTGFALFASPAGAGEPQILKTPMDVVNYGIGVEMGRNFSREGVEFDADLVLKGMRDGYAGEKLLVSEAVLRKAIQDFRSEMRRKQVFNRNAPELDGKKGDDHMSSRSR